MSLSDPKSGAYWSATNELLSGLEHSISKYGSWENLTPRQMVAIIKAEISECDLAIEMGHIVGEEGLLYEAAQAGSCFIKLIATIRNQQARRGDVK